MNFSPLQSFKQAFIFTCSVLCFSANSLAADSSPAPSSSFAKQVDFVQHENAVTRASLGYRFNEHAVLLVGAGWVETAKMEPTATYDKMGAEQYVLTFQSFTGSGGFFGSSGYGMINEVQIGSYFYKDYVKDKAGKSERTNFFGGAFKLAVPIGPSIGYQIGVAFEYRGLNAGSQVKNIGLTPLGRISVGPVWSVYL